MKVNLRKHEAGSAWVKEKLNFDNCGSPIFVVLRDGFWFIVNRTYRDETFFAITPEGGALEELGFEREYYRNSDSQRMRFRALLSQMADRYDISIPESGALYDHWKGSYARLPDQTFQFDYDTKEWQHVRV